MEDRHSAVADSYTVRMERLRQIFADADTEALRCYKTDYPSFWLQDVRRFCSTVARLWPVFRKDCTDFLDSLLLLFGPESGELVFGLAESAARLQAVKCVEWLCSRPRLMLNSAVMNTAEAYKTPYFHLNFSKMTPFVVQHQLAPSIECFKKTLGQNQSARYAREMKTCCRHVFYKTIRALVNENAARVHTCGSSSVLCMPLMHGATCPANAFCADGFVEFWQFIAGEHANTLLKLAPWLLLLNAPASLIESAAVAAISSKICRSPPEAITVFDLLLRLPPDRARALHGRLLSAYTARLFEAQAPSEKEVEKAQACVNYFYKVARVIPSAEMYFVAYVLALLTYHEAAEEFCELFKSVDGDGFGVDCITWQFKGERISADLLVRLIDAVQMLYQSACIDTSSFTVAVADCLRVHPARTAELTKNMDKFGEFNWLALPTPAPVQTPAQTPAPAQTPTQTVASAPHKSLVRVYPWVQRPQPPQAKSQCCLCCLC